MYIEFSGYSAVPLEQQLLSHKGQVQCDQMQGRAETEIESCPVSPVSKDA